MRSLIRDYIKTYGELPFKIYKENGTEIVILPLDDEEEEEIIKRLEDIERILNIVSLLI